MPNPTEKKPVPYHPVYHRPADQLKERKGNSLEDVQTQMGRKLVDAARNQKKR